MPNRNRVTKVVATGAMLAGLGGIGGVGGCHVKVSHRVSFGSSYQSSNDPLHWSDERMAVERTMTAWHNAARVGDKKTYFKLMTNDVVFLGTDPTERWVGKAFRAMCEPHFDGTEAWTYISQERHVGFSGDEAIAWVDEVLLNAHYGTCRGTAVLVQQDDGSYTIAQYGLALLIPNASAKAVVELVREADER